MAQNTKRLGFELKVCMSLRVIGLVLMLVLVLLVLVLVYSAAYITDPSSRGKGMMIGFLANMALLLCCLIAAISYLF